MADRTSAGIFGTLFRWLAQEPADERRDAFARKLWAMTLTLDFHPYQMEATDALRSLGLAHDECDDDGNAAIAWGPQ